MQVNHADIHVEDSDVVDTAILIVQVNQADIHVDNSYMVDTAILTGR